MTTTPGGQSGPDENGDIATHPAAVWRERADFILQVDLARHDMPGKWEQLWARRLDEHRFELCSIPFFAYGMTLGDVVGTLPGGFQVGSVVRRSGRHLIRAAFLAAPPPALHERLHAALIELAIPNEWHGSGYLACSPAGEADLAAVLQLLHPLAARGELMLERDP